MFLHNMETKNLTKTNSISFLYFIKLSLNSLDLFLNYFHNTKIEKMKGNNNDRYMKSY